MSPSDIHLNAQTLTRFTSLVKTRLMQLQSPGVYLDYHLDEESRDHIVCVTSLEGSTRLFKFNDDHSLLVSFASDSKSRAGLCHQILASSNLILSSSKDRIVAGIPIPHHARLQQASAPLFECELPSSVTRFVHASIRPSWKQSHQQDGPIPNDIIGVTTDGSVISFQLLNEPLWRLLRFVANMAVRDARLCRLEQSQPGVLHRKHIEPLDNDPKSHHVDGDLLARIVSARDPHALLNELLSKVPVEGLVALNHRGGLASIDFETADARRARFDELVELALWSLIDEGQASAEQEVASAGNDRVQWTVQLIERLLQSPF